MKKQELHKDLTQMLKYSKLGHTIYAPFQIIKFSLNPLNFLSLL
ncbi:hypothetical protein SAMN05444280_13010 [Tangfeifania diversioriginum]|uniref:Uncharacterized protein n=1 Tax=Tangfeifania diversioriginum TaxID=1168035 RepID=A0A1M6M4C3_9BACT|nr:hypothetical protein SAMN05444280_13010 [Tangfeifania diversioriginum]